MTFLKFFKSKARRTRMKFSRRKENWQLAASIATVIACLATVGGLIGLWYQIDSGNKQIRLLKNQSRLSNTLMISQLGDRCMWYSENGGELNCYLTLNDLKEELEAVDKNSPHLKTINNQLERVKASYRDQDIRNLFLNRLPFVKEDPKDDPLSNFLLHIYRGQWQERAKAAYRLRSIDPQQREKRKKEVFSALLYNLSDTEWSLLVRKTALDTYTEFTGYEPPKDNIFDFKGAIEHCIRNNPNINK